jgi:ATP-dependent Clp protease, protease subunit
VTHAGEVGAKLFEQRRVFLTEALDNAAASALCPQLMLLDADGDDRIELMIDSSGGHADACLAVIDVIDLLGVPITATCVGRADGPALAVLAACDHRRVAPHALLRFRYDATTISGPVASVEARVRWLKHGRDAVVTRLAASTALTADEVERAFDTQRVVTAVEAIDLGIADELTSPTRQLRPVD